MRYLIFCFLVLSNLSLQAETQNPSLSGLTKFEVFSLLPQEKMDKNAIYGSFSAAFKKYGNVTVSESESMFNDLLQRKTVDGSVCFFSIDKDKDQNQVKVSLNVFEEVEVVSNKQKTACSIWKKTLWSSIPDGNDNQTELAIAKLVQAMIDDLIIDWRKANPNTKQMSFHINKFHDL